jgi:hypothetical protein
MIECHLRVFFLTATQLRLTTMHMVITSGLAGIKPCGSMLRVMKFFHLFMRRRLVGHQSQGKRHLMKCKVHMAPNCQGMGSPSTAAIAQMRVTTLEGAS